MKLFSKIAALSVGLAMAVGVGVAVGSGKASEARADGVVASFSRSGTTNSVTGGTFSSAAEAKSGYYQDGSGTDRYIQVLSNAAYWTTTPSSISLTCVLGGGTGNKDLANPVKAWLLDSAGSVISSTETSITSKITTNTGDTYSDVAIPLTNNVYGIRVGHTKESGYNVRYYSFSLSYVGDGPVVETHDITFNANGTGVTNMPSTLENQSGTVALSGVQSPEREGYNFVGWSLTSSGETVPSVTIESNDIELYAIWAEKTSTNYVESSLKEGKLLITTSWDGDTYYLPTATSSSAAPAAVKFTDVSEIDPENLWNVSSSDGAWVFQNDDNKYLAITGTSNNSIRIGSTSGSWTVQEDTSLKGANNRYLGIYNGADWRSYNSSTADNYKESATSLVFYEVSSSPSTDSLTIKLNDSQTGPFELPYSSTSTALFYAKDSDNNAVNAVWTSSNETVFTVTKNSDNVCVLHYVNPGKATLTASAEGYSNGTASVTVTKGNPQTVVVSGSMTKKDYIVGEQWSADGLFATVTYSTGYVEADANVNWTFNPSAPAKGVTSVVATATCGTASGNSSAQAVTVTKVNVLQAIYSMDENADVEAYGVFVGNKDTNNIIIMDGAYGMNVYKSGIGTNSYVEGETILHVTGKVGLFNGLYQIKSPTIEVVESADVETPVTYIAKGGETVDYSSRLTNATGVPTVTKGDITADAGTADITMVFDLGGEKSVQVFYKKAIQTASAEWYSAIGDAVANSNPITIKGFTSWYNGTFQIQMTELIESSDSYKAEDFAQDLLDATGAVCVNYVDGESDYGQFKSALTVVWNNLQANDKYLALKPAEKERLAEATREGDEVINQAMYRYDFLVGKYDLANFITGRSPILVSGSYIANYQSNIDSSSSITIIVIVAATSMTLLGVTLVLRKRKHR